MGLRVFTCSMIALFVGGRALAAEIKVIGGSAVIPAMAELIPKFEQSSGQKVRARRIHFLAIRRRRLAKQRIRDAVMGQVRNGHIAAVAGERRHVGWCKQTPRG